MASIQALNSEISFSDTTSCPSNQHHSAFVRPSEDDIGSLSIRYAKASAILRYTPPPAELHLFLPTDASRHPLPSVNHPDTSQLSSTSSSGLGQSRNDPSPMDNPDNLTQTRKPLKTISGKISHTDRKVDKKPTPYVVKPEDSNNKNSHGTPLSARPSTQYIYANYYYRGKNAIDAEERFQQLLEQVSNHTVASYTLEDALESIAKPSPFKSRLRREDAALSRLHRIYNEYADEEIMQTLSKHGLVEGASDHFKAYFEIHLSEEPASIGKLMEMDKVLHSLKRRGGRFSNPFTDWAAVVVSTIHHLRFTEGWNAIKNMRERQRLNQLAFENIYQAEIKRWNQKPDGAYEQDESLKIWMKHQEKVTCSRNQILKLYNTFGATVFLEVNTLRPVNLNDPVGRSQSFAPLAKRIETEYRTALQEDEHLLVFEAKFWDDDLEHEDLDGDQLYSEAIIRSHTAASQLITSIVKVAAGERTAEWVSKFFHENTPIGFEDEDTD